MYKYIKRALDFCAALGAIIVLSPVLLIVALLVKTKLGSPVLFKQERPGMIDSKTGEEKIFTLCKFRTMTDERDNNGNLLPDTMRITKVGKFIRSTSLDELPQLWNVFKGDMSLIGPRPLLPQYLPLYSTEQSRRHEVRPGITGWAQINGRNSISWTERFKYDIWYINNVSFLTDLRIIFLTIKKVIVRDGINSATSATMEDFNGTN